MAERTGSLGFSVLWSYVEIHATIGSYIDNIHKIVSERIQLDPLISNDMLSSSDMSGITQISLNFQAAGSKNPSTMS